MILNKILTKFCFIFVPVPIVNVKVVAGDPVYLPCDITSSDPHDQVLLVLWYREDLGTPIYRYVFSETSKFTTFYISSTSFACVIIGNTVSDTNQSKM